MGSSLVAALLKHRHKVIILDSLSTENLENIRLLTEPFYHSAIFFYCFNRNVAIYIVVTEIASAEFVNLTMTEGSCPAMVVCVAKRSFDKVAAR